MRIIDTENLRNAPREQRARDEILRQARSQQSLANKFEDLLGDGGQPNETADEMVRAIREWRDFSSARSPE